MFGSMDFAIYTQDLLRPRNANVVHRLKSKMAESGAQTGSSGKHQANAGCASMEIQSEMRPESTDCHGVRRKDLIDVRIAGKDRCKSIFDDYANLKIGPHMFE